MKFEGGEKQQNMVQAMEKNRMANGFDLKAGAARRKAEAERLADIKARAAVPDRCGPEIIAQPARGPMMAQAPMGLIPDGSATGWKREHLGYRGRDYARQADAFDLMELQARRAAKGGEVVQLFSAAQVGAARRYAMLVERHDAAGMRCSSVEAQRSSGGGGGGSFIDTVLYEGDVIRAMRRAIGDGVAMAVRRVRPSARGSRVGIRDRVLVDLVCLHGQTVSQVLASHGWADKGDNRGACRIALCDALDRMSLARILFGEVVKDGA